MGTLEKLVINKEKIQPPRLLRKVFRKVGLVKFSEFEFEMARVSRENLDLVETAFIQGDNRYFEFHDLYLVAYFLDARAIEIEERLVPRGDPPTEEDLKKIIPPQQYYKFIARNLFETEGYELVDFELPYQGGRADILAEDPATGETLAVECCSCGISKAINYLVPENSTLWVLERGEKETLTKPLSLYIVRRGPHWDELRRAYREDTLDSMRTAMEAMWK